MGTNMNKFIPLPPAQMKYLELHNISLLMINTMMNTEMSSNMQHPLASDRKDISPDPVGSICRIMNQKNVWLQKNDTSSLLPANSTPSNSSSLLHDQSSESF
jgi:hypothetical protein